MWMLKQHERSFSEVMRGDVRDPGEKVHTMLSSSGFFHSDTFQGTQK